MDEACADRLALTLQSAEIDDPHNTKLKFRFFSARFSRTKSGFPIKVRLCRILDMGFIFAQKLKISNGLALPNWASQHLTSRLK